MEKKIKIEKKELSIFISQTGCNDILDVIESDEFFYADLIYTYNPEDGWSYLLDNHHCKVYQTDDHYGVNRIMDLLRNGEAEFPLSSYDYNEFIKEIDGE